MIDAYETLTSAPDCFRAQLLGMVKAEAQSRPLRSGSKGYYRDVGHCPSGAQIGASSSSQSWACHSVRRYRRKLASFWHRTGLSYVYTCGSLFQNLVGTFIPLCSWDCPQYCHPVWRLDIAPCHSHPQAEDVHLPRISSKCPWRVNRALKLTEAQYLQQATFVRVAVELIPFLALS